MAEKSDKTPQQKMAEAIGIIAYGAMEDVTSIYTGSLKSINGKKAVVTMNGQDQNVAVVSPELLTGAITRVFVPNGNMSNAFIVGKGKSSDEPTLPTVQIATGSYSGSGNSNKRTLTFDFSPRYVVVQGYNSNGWHSIVIFQYQANYYGYEEYSNTSYRSTSLTVSWGSKSITWGGTSATNSMNAFGNTYRWFAIGY